MPSKNQRKYEIGSQFDDLHVIGYTTDSQGRATYQCQCVCGKVVERRPALLADNKTNNCGCRPRGKWKGRGQVSLTYFNHTRYHAKRRGLSFLVSLEYVAKLLEEQKERCALTGVEIGFGKKRRDRYTASLDRIDNTKGYEEGNVWWVHSVVNRMKNDAPLQDFLEWCRLVSQKTTPLAPQVHATAP